MDKVNYKKEIFMKIKRALFVVAIIASMLASCAALMPASSTRSSGGGAQDMAVAPQAAPVMEKAMAEESAPSSDFSGSGVSAERIVIKNANLSIVVTDPVVSMEAISKLASGMGGFVVTSNLYKTTTSSGIEVPVANITIRVPVAQLDSALNQIKAMVGDKDVDILSEDVSGQDVTSEVTDLESRLRNLQAAETQLLEIMDKATKTEDVISVFRELTSVRGEIEVIQGQIKYYRESASLSAINVNLQAKASVEPITIAGWQPGVEVQRALQALVNGGKYLVNVLIWLVLFALPFLAIIFLPIFFIVKAIRKRKAAKKTKEPKKEA
jgi:hypothetical protein